MDTPRQDPDDEGRDGAAPTAGDASDAVAGPIRVLHVDDDADITELTAEMLARELPAARVTAANDAREALAILADEPVDCLVSDLEMPEIDGLELLARVREAYPDLPVILYTATAGDDVAAEALSLGATDYVEKGGTAAQYTLLANRIENAVARARAERAVAVGSASSDGDDGRSDRASRSYREIFEGVNDAIFVHDAETGALVDVNQKTCDLLGAPREEVLGYTIGDFSAGEPYTHEEGVARVHRAATEGPQLFEWRAVDADGKEFWMEVNLKRAVIGDEERVLAVVRDVTERRRQETALDALHTSTRELLQARSAEAIAEIVVDAAAVVLDGSAAALRLADDYGGSVVSAPGTASVVGSPPDASDGRLRDRFVEAGLVVYETDLDDHGRLVVGSGSAGDWTETDLDLVEILEANAIEALARTERESELRDERDRINALFESVTDAVVYAEYADDEPIIREVNPAFEEVFGYDAEEVADESLDELVVAPDGRSEAEELNAAIVEGTHVERVVERRTASGPREFVFRATPAELDGDRRGSFGLYLDITEQKRRERTLEVLHESSRKLMQARTERDICRATVETMKEVLNQPLSVIHLYDEGAERLSPVAMTAEVKRMYDESQGPLDFLKGEGLVGRAFESGETRIHDELGATDLVRDDDGLRSALVVPVGESGVLFVGSRSAGAFGEFHVYFMELLAANAEVALERARHVQLLRERENALVRERDHSEALFENVPDPAVKCTFVDGEPIVRATNSAFEEVFGYDADEVAGESLDDYIIAPDREEEAVDLNRTLQEGANVHAEVRRETADGVRDFLLHVVPFKVGERSVHGYAIYTDITERKEHEAMLTRQNERLEEFASIVSHDLRNPLNVAQGFLSLARETDDDDHFERVAGAHDRMDRLIAELLDLARQGMVVGDLSPTDLGAVAERAWKNVETGSATLEAVEGYEFEADGARLGELLENLFRNAVEHGSTSNRQGAGDAVEHGSAGDRPEAGDRDEHADDGVTVRVGALDGGEGFYVADDGPGIDEAERERVFESGYTTAADGTGFGLAIVQRIAEAHGWGISATEGEDGGARFEIRL